MNWVSGIVVFAITWWIVLLAVLPWGVRPPDQVEPGHAYGAPARPRRGLKVVVTTGVTIVIWLIIYALVSADVFSFRDWAGQMPI